MQVVPGIPLDIPTCPTWYNGIGRTGGIWWAQVVPGIPLDSPTCPTWYSGIGRTGGMWWAQVVPGIQSHLSYMVW